MPPDPFAARASSLLKVWLLHAVQSKLKGATLQLLHTGKGKALGMRLGKGRCIFLSKGMKCMLACILE